MKYITIAAVIMLSLISCNNKQQEKSSIEPMYPCKIVIIEGCEYIENQGYHSYSLTHKGNCKNHQK